MVPGLEELAPDIGMSLTVKIMSKNVVTYFAVFIGFIIFNAINISLGIFYTEQMPAITP